MTKFFQCSFVFLMISSCEPPGSGLGPCVHIFEEPILTIQSVNSAETGNSLSTIVLFEVTIDGIGRDATYLTQEMSENITIEDSVLICSIPCGFGTLEGIYQFSVKSEGFKDTLITENATYNKSEGGCPSSSSEGSKITFSLHSE